MKERKRIVWLIGIFVGIFCIRSAAFVPEKLNRGLVAVKTEGGVFVSWRLFSTDDDSTSFDLYRDGVKVNSQPIVLTNYFDAGGSVTSEYVVKTLCRGKQVEHSTAVSSWEQPFLRIHLNRPADGVTPPFRAVNRGRIEERPEGEHYSYEPNDCSVGDVDGDGEYEIIVKWNPTNARDNSFRGYTGEVYLDCYKLDGRQLWRIGLGKNIRAGAHYTQFMVYDLDGDGRSEVACKTAPGTVDGTGKYVLLDGDDPLADYRTPVGDEVVGTIMEGPEYLTVFDGETGAEVTTIPYVPGRDVTNDWGDRKANRSERYLACVAYLDGEKPSLVMCRGYYMQAYIAAFDFDGRELKLRWLHRSEKKERVFTAKEHIASRWPTSIMTVAMRLFTDLQCSTMMERCCIVPVWDMEMLCMFQISYPTGRGWRYSWYMKISAELMCVMRRREKFCIVKKTTKIPDEGLPPTLIPAIEVLNFVRKLHREYILPLVSSLSPGGVFL